MRFLNDFFAEFRAGFQRPARFECSVIAPQPLLQALSSGLFTSILDVLLPTIGQRVDDNFSIPSVNAWLQRGLLVSQARLPSRNLETTPFNLYGYSEQVPFQTEYADFHATFQTPLVASDNAIPRFFSYWQNFIHAMQNGPDSGADFRFPRDYYGTIFMSTFDNRDNPSLTYRFDNAYPKTVDSVEVGWSDESQFMKQSVAFAYSYWKVMPYQPPPLIDIEINLPF